MTNEQAKKMLKAKLECLKRETSGTDFDCNNSNCDECSLCYEQGNMGEQKQALDMAIKALEQEPCEDAIRRADAEALFRNARSKLNPSDYKTADEFNTRDLMLLNAEQFIHLLPSVRPQKPKTGHWIDIMVGDMPAQACDRCNTFYPLSYTGGGHRYCPNCGAKMIEPQESEKINCKTTKYERSYQKSRQAQKVMKSNDIR
ncbi:hypothetical protein ACR73B_17095 [Enterococcus innesii]|uniref:hypothetical protein n=1 Tax=Enterococcus innesii TaxID=2839759 RepID=UPI003DA38D61